MLLIVLLRANFAYCLIDAIDDAPSIFESLAKLHLLWISFRAQGSLEGW